jgi:hypothetical protein
MKIMVEIFDFIMLPVDVLVSFLDNFPVISLTIAYIIAFIVIYLKEPINEQ